MKRGTPRSPKLLHLCELLKVRVPTAVGYLELLWHFTAEFAPQGDIGRFDDRWIEAALFWSGRPGHLLHCLAMSGWVDVHPEWRLLTHDWHDHADDAVRKRLSRSSLQFLTFRGKVTGQSTVSDRTMSPTQVKSGSLPEPEPEPEPEPIPQTPNAPVGAFDLSPSSQVKRKPAKKSGKRTTEEIKEAMGDRLVWWEEFWKVYPCHDGMNPAFDVYERKVKTREMAADIWRGASRYAARVAAERRSDPESKVKFAQGWLNDERWLDDAAPAPRLVEPPRKYFDPRSITG